MRDNKVVEAENKHGITMVFMGIRHFKHIALLKIS